MSRKLLVLSGLLLTACTVQRWQPTRAAGVDDHTSHMSVADLRAPRSMGSTESNFQGTPGLPPSNLQAAARIKASPRHAEWVKIAWEPGSKDSLMAWIVYPVSRNKAPVVVVVHEIFGLSSWVRGVADQLADDGFIAIAPDLLSRVRGGPSADELTGDSARKIQSAVPQADKDKGVQSVANYAMSQPSAEKRYGIVGYCWGGVVAFNHAVFNGKGLAAAVSYYGTPYTMRNPADTTKTMPAVDSLRKITVPVMLLNGTADARISAVMPAIDSIMRGAGKSYVGKNYEGAIHGFLRAQDDPTTAGAVAPAGAANLAATKEAWPLTIAFFKKNLGVK